VTFVSHDESVVDISEPCGATALLGCCLYSGYLCLIRILLFEPAIVTIGGEKSHLLSPSIPHGVLFLVYVFVLKPFEGILRFRVKYVKILSLGSERLVL
jgi:hypothetical protein